MFGYVVDCNESESKTNESLRENNSSKTGFQIGKKYILLDMGGGTVDIACHKVLEGGKVSEVAPPSGGDWGSTYIDDEFIKVLGHVLPKGWVDKIRKKESFLFMQLMDNFRYAKRLFYKIEGAKKKKKKKKKVTKKSTYHNVEIPVKLITLLDKMVEKDDKLSGEYDDFEEFMENSKYFEDSKYAPPPPSLPSTRIPLPHANVGKLSSSDEYLRMTHHVWFSMFNKVLDPIISHVSSLMKDYGPFDHLVMVGGMSESPYVQMKIKEAFLKNSKLSLFIPRRPILAVVRGAVLLAKNPNYIYSRRMRKTYGTRSGLPEEWCRKRGVSEEFIEKHKFFSKNANKHYVSGIFHRLLKKGDVVRVNEVSRPFILHSFESLYISNPCV